MFSKKKMNDSTNSYSDKILQIKEKIGEADAVVIGAGAGFSTSAGFCIMEKDLKSILQILKRNTVFPICIPEASIHIKHWKSTGDTGADISILTDIWMLPKPVYQNLYELVKEKDYFVLTTNVDHCFQKSGFDKNRIFYTQGDYGFFNVVSLAIRKPMTMKQAIKKNGAESGISDKDGELQKPENGEIKLTVPVGLIPYCPRCGKPMSMNLRSDQTFVEDNGWHRAAEKYEKFIQDHKKQKIVFLELG